MVQLWRLWVGVNIRTIFVKVFVRFIEFINVVPFREFNNYRVFRGFLSFLALSTTDVRYTQRFGTLYNDKKT